MHVFKVLDDNGEPLIRADQIAVFIALTRESDGVSITDLHDLSSPHRRLALIEGARMMTDCLRHNVLSSIKQDGVGYKYKPTRDACAYWKSHKAAGKSNQEIWDAWRKDHQTK